jgi:hypothetical protein
MFNELFGLSVLEVVRSSATSAEGEPETELSLSARALLREITELGNHNTETTM